MKVVAKPRTLRADAERNRRRVLEVAEHAFATEGLAVPIDEVARRSGLGIGTVYRHFPTKDALFEAIVIARIERVTAYAEELAKARHPGPAFFDFLDRLVADGVAKKDLVEALGHAGVDLTAQTQASKARLRRALTKLISRAQDAGAVRDDVSAADVLSLVRGLFAATGTDSRARARHLAILADGLRRR